MKRFHVHVAVSNLTDSIGFYSKMFASEPAVIKADYAKWMLDDPRVNFAISSRGATPGLNHLGVQVESASELGEMRNRLQTLQDKIIADTDAECCYAKSDKYWATDPQGIAWETFHTLDTIPVFGEDSQDTCCVPLANGAEKDASRCVPTQAGCC